MPLDSELQLLAASARAASAARAAAPVILPPLPFDKPLSPKHSTHQELHGMKCANTNLL
jgi:hypothetical protein